MVDTHHSCSYSILGGQLEDAIKLAVVDSFTEQDGYVDDPKVKVSLMIMMRMVHQIIPLAIDDLIPRYC